VRNKNYIHKEIKSRLNLGMLATVQFRILAPAHLLSEAGRVKTCKTLLLVVLCGL
jgi:hypothetical protein